MGGSVRVDQWASSAGTAIFTSVRTFHFVVRIVVRSDDGPCRHSCWRDRKRKPLWLMQLWFAGNHSDVSGSYPDDESRLSDITLRWMIDELLAIPSRPRLNAGMLQTFGDPSAPQHDEVRASRDAWFPRWWPRMLRFGWKPKLRAIKPGAKLHPSVVARLREGLVPDYDVVRPYRPANLVGHDEARGFY